MDTTPCRTSSPAEQKARELAEALCPGRQLTTEKRPAPNGWLAGVLGESLLWGQGPTEVAAWEDLVLILSRAILARTAELNAERHRLAMAHLHKVGYLFKEDPCDRRDRVTALVRARWPEPLTPNQLLNTILDTIRSAGTNVTHADTPMDPMDVLEAIDALTEMHLDVSDRVWGKA